MSAWLTKERGRKGAANQRCRNRTKMSWQLAIKPKGNRDRRHVQNVEARRNPAQQVSTENRREGAMGDFVLVYTGKEVGSHRSLVALVCARCFEYRLDTTTMRRRSLLVLLRIKRESKFMFAVHAGDEDIITDE
jgi:hypothetical protein